AVAGRDGGNSRNGKSRKRVKTDTAELDLEVPRDRDGTFDPVIVEGSAAAAWLRRQGHRPLRPGDDDAGDPGAPEGAVRGRGVAGADLCGDGRGAGGRAGVAGAPARGRLSDRVPRRDPR